MLITKVYSNPVLDEFLTVYLLAVNRLAELRAELLGVDERNRLEALGRFKNLKTKCDTLERLVFTEMEPASDARF